MWKLCVKKGKINYERNDTWYSEFSCPMPSPGDDTYSTFSPGNQRNAVEPSVEAGMDKSMITQVQRNA